MSWRTICAVAVLLAACDRAPSGNDETAAELRALRMFLQQQPAGRPAASGADARATIAEALAPLREVVTTLAKAQTEQAARQLALTQELQRWSQLLVETSAGAHANDTKAMAARLQQLEQSMREQDARHREVEALMQGALERTADRLQEFLQQLAPDGAGAAAERAAPGASPPATGQKAAGEKGDQKVADPKSAVPKIGDAKTGDPKAGDPKAAAPRTGDAVLPHEPRGDDHALLASGRAPASGPRAEQWLWLGLAAGALGVGAFFVARARRSTPMRRAFTGASVPLHESPVHQQDPGVEEIWAAAALLGETVSRLRQTSAAAPQGAPGNGIAVPDGLDLDEVFVLDDFDARSPAVAAPERLQAEPGGPAEQKPSEKVAVAGRPQAPPGPDLVVCRLHAADLECARKGAAKVLADDPRVLRRPAPCVVANGNRVEVTFATLPGLAASERSLLEQRLRDAVA